MKKQDFILIGIILSAAIIIFAVLHFFVSDGAYVKIEVNSETVKTLPLNEDTEYLIETENGTNLLVIKDGKAKVTEADCPDKICARHSEISKNGESIICLPHKTVISIVDENDENEIDAGV